MKVAELLQDIGYPVAFHPDIVPIAGTHKAAILLCQIIYWHGKQKDMKGWIYKTQKAWFMETGLTIKEQRGARRILTGRGLIEEVNRGMPARLEYRLKEQDVRQIWNVWMTAVNIKKQYLDLEKEHGLMYSKGYVSEKVKSNFDRYYKAFEECERAAKKFFENCEKNGQAPISLIDKLNDSLKKIAEKLPPIQKIDT